MYKIDFSVSRSSSKHVCTYIGQTYLEAKIANKLVRKVELKERISMSDSFFFEILLEEQGILPELH